MSPRASGSLLQPLRAIAADGRRSIADALFETALGADDPPQGPQGDPGLFGPGSMAWRVHANPVVLAVGGVAAVILELAEPRVRAGVWNHSSFRTDPLRRMRRTAQAALVTTFGPTAAAQARIETVKRLHAPVAGTTTHGEAYSAVDPDLCDWVHVTAGWGFLTAYRRLLAPDLPEADQDRYWAEGVPIAQAYGAGAPPQSQSAATAMMLGMRPRLGRDPILEEFLAIISRTSPLGPAGRPLQPLLAAAAIAILPAWAVAQLGLAGRSTRRAAALAALAVLARAAAAEPVPIMRAAHERVGLVAPRG
jgi:uncharacterized protein (DUF2236 family)